MLPILIRFPTLPNGVHPRYPRYPRKYHPGQRAENANGPPRRRGPLQSRGAKLLLDVVDLALRGGFSFLPRPELDHIAIVQTGDAEGGAGIF
jgi:hypothetical protein